MQVSSQRRLLMREFFADAPMIRVVIGMLLLLTTMLVYVVSQSVSISHEFESVQIFLVALLLAYYCSLALWDEFRSQRFFSPISCFAGLILIHYAVPALFYVADLLDFRFDANSFYIGKCLLFVLVCFSMIHLGTALARNFGQGKAVQRIEHHYVWGRARIIVLLAVFFVIGWVVRFSIIAAGAYFQIDRSSSSGTFHALKALVETFPTFGFMICLIMYFHRKSLTLPSRTWNYIAWIVGGSEFLYWLGAGRKFEAILALIIPVIVRYIYTKKLPGKFVVVSGVVTVLLLFPALFYYRIVIERGAEIDAQVRNIPQIVATSMENMEGASAAARIVGRRVNMNEFTGAAIRLVDTREWDMRNGLDYANVVVNLVPRFLWSGKPDFHYGTDFGHSAGLTSISDDKTSVSVTYFGEAYLNFKWAGAFVFLIIAFFSEKLFGAALALTNPVWVLIYIVYLKPLLYLGGTVAMYFGGFVKVLIFLTLIGLSMVVSKIAIGRDLRALNSVFLERA